MLPLSSQLHMSHLKAKFCLRCPDSKHMHGNPLPSFRLDNDAGNPNENTECLRPRQSVALIR